MESIQTNNLNNEIDFSNEELFTDDYLNQLINLSFAYYDHHNDKENFENNVNNFIGNFSSNIKSSMIKNHLKFFIDFIEKYSTADIKFIENSLLNLKLKNDFIDLFKNMLKFYSDNVENMKNAIIEKITNNRIKDFSYSFYVKFIDSSSEKVNFIIKLNIKYSDDNEEIKNIELDLTLNQFYYIFEEFQKIDTMIKTLI